MRLVCFRSFLSLVSFTGRQLGVPQLQTASKIAAEARDVLVTMTTLHCTALLQADS